MSPHFVQSSLFLSYAGERIRHGFFTRQGGFSTGIYASLNAGPGSDDQMEHVQKNRDAIANVLKIQPQNLLSLHQVHSADVITIDHPFGTTRPKADAMVSKIAGLGLGILTADCGPVLFADSHNGIIGAAHAGWRGAFSGILENTVAAMEQLGARRQTIKAALGPSISQHNYQVSAEFRQTFLNKDLSYKRFFVPSDKESHFQFDLWQFIKDTLNQLDIETDITGHCTYAQEQSFFSYRRTTHRGEPDYGRQLSVITLEDK